MNISHEDTKDGHKGTKAFFVCSFYFVPLCEKEV
jgi:hypothetical protein